jgi:Uma2 family endonuclease
MATVNPPEPDNLAELLRRLGGVPLARIRLKPPPGTATEKDVLRAYSGINRRLCELVDGVLVEKAVGTQEALLASILVELLWGHVRPRRLGLVLGADGMLRLMPGLVRIPDVSFISRKQLPGGRLPKQAIAHLVPDLAVEVLSKGNTPKEIDRKLRDYFINGTTLVWVIRPKTETADVYTSPTDRRHIDKEGALEGDPVLPGFSLPLTELFGRTCVEDEPA